MTTAGSQGVADPAAVQDVHYLELREVAQRVQSREISAVELTELELERIDRVDSRLHSFTIVTAELAMEQARRADAEIGRGEIRGPLHGVPVAVKDCADTKGIVTASGMPMLKDRIPTEDATVIRRLAEAGSILLGKLVLTEGVYAEHREPFGCPLNPWNEKYWAGASSSGSGVALAAGLCFGALGSDTGGSIRLPSSMNGVTGMRPTWGRVSRNGVFELAATLDQVGPMARCAADAAAILSVIAGTDPADPTTSRHPVPDYLAELGNDIRGVRIGIDPKYAFKDVDATTVKTVSDAIGVLIGLGAELREIDFPDPTEILNDWFGVCAVQTARAHEATYPSRKAEYGQALSDLLELGNGLSGVEYQKLLLRRALFRGRVEAMFADVDLMVIPALAFITPAVDKVTKMDEAMILGLHQFTCPFPMTSNPTITMPAGFTPEQLPIAVQLVARHFDEGMLVRAGHAFQSATDWHRRHPGL
jgi:amidase